jgi:hypothetical protein
MTRRKVSPRTSLGSHSSKRWMIRTLSAWPLLRVFSSYTSCSLLSAVQSTLQFPFSKPCSRKFAQTLSIGSHYNPSYSYLSSYPAFTVSTFRGKKLINFLTTHSNLVMSPKSYSTPRRTEWLTRVRVILLLTGSQSVSQSVSPTWLWAPICDSWPYICFTTKFWFYMSWGALPVGCTGPSCKRSHSLSVS